MRLQSSAHYSRICIPGCNSVEGIKSGDQSWRYARGYISRWTNFLRWSHKSQADGLQWVITIKAAQYVASSVFGIPQAQDHCRRCISMDGRPLTPECAQKLTNTTLAPSRPPHASTRPTCGTYVPALQDIPGILYSQLDTRPRRSRRRQTHQRLPQDVNWFFQTKTLDQITKCSNGELPCRHWYHRCGEGIVGVCK